MTENDIKKLTELIPGKVYLLLLRDMSHDNMAKWYDRVVNLLDEQKESPKIIMVTGDIKFKEIKTQCDLCKFKFEEVK